MNTTYIVGQILGMTFLIISISIILNVKIMAMVTEKMIKDNPRIWLTGFISVLFGSILLAFSNFSNVSTSIVALLGILSFIKGIFLLWFPNLSAKFYSNKLKNKLYIFIYGVIMLIISLILIFTSF